jgi:tetratricopeptide (TPR) repeat protein
MVNNTPGMSDYHRFMFALYERDWESARVIHGEAPDSVILGQFWVPTRSLYSAWIHQLQGNHGAAHAAFDSARVRIEQWEQDHPGDFRVHYSLGLAYAGLGRSSDAAERAAMRLEAKHVQEGDEIGLNAAAEILAAAGLAEEAVGLLENLFEGPGSAHPCDARFFLTFDPIRSHPRFQALLEEHAPDVEH